MAVRLSENMRGLLAHIREHATAARPWVKIGWGSHWDGRTIGALDRRGLVDVRYRTEALNPNDVPKLTTRQFMHENLVTEPWCRLTEEDA